MTIPSTPKFQKEGPSTACVLDHQLLGWKNCTCLSFAMGIDKGTGINGHPKVRITGCQVRGEILPRDTTGGTTIEQNARVAALHGIDVAVYTGGNVASPTLLALSLQAGCGASVAGNEMVTKGKNVNHNVWVNQSSGGTTGHPATVTVYDPDSDGPATWTWAKLMKFAHALHPWGESDPRTLASLGISGVYAGIFPDTEPHYHPTHGGVMTKPFPDHLKGKAGASLKARHLRPGPGLQYAPYPQNPTLAPGQEFVAYQWVNGAAVNGRTRWYGDHAGVYWISAAGITGEGGS